MPIANVNYSFTMFCNYYECIYTVDIVLKRSAVYRQSIHSKLALGNKFSHRIIWPSNFRYGQSGTPLLTIQLKSKCNGFITTENVPPIVHTAVSAMQIVYSRRKKIDSKINFIICSMIGTGANGTKNFYGINWHLLDFLSFFAFAVFISEINKRYFYGRLWCLHISQHPRRYRENVINFINFDARIELFITIFVDETWSSGFKCNVEQSCD